MNDLNSENHVSTNLYEQFVSPRMIIKLILLAQELTTESPSFINQDSAIFTFNINQLKMGYYSETCSESPLLFLEI